MGWQVLLFLHLLSSVCALHGKCTHVLQVWPERGTSRSLCASAGRQATSLTTCT